MSFYKANRVSLPPSYAYLETVACYWTKYSRALLDIYNLLYICLPLVPLKFVYASLGSWVVLGGIPEAALSLFLNFTIHLGRRALVDRSKEEVFCGKASVWASCDLQADVTENWFAVFDWEGGHILPLVF